LALYPEIPAQRIACAVAFVGSGLFYHSEIIKENIAADRSGHLQDRAHRQRFALFGTERFEIKAEMLPPPCLYRYGSQRLPVGFLQSLESANA
jgi:hypothetical protein